MRRKTEELEKVVKQIIELLSIETFLRFKGFRPTNKSICNSAGVWENKDESLAIVFYEIWVTRKIGEELQKQMGWVKMKELD